MFLHRYYEIEMHDAGILQVSILYTTPTSYILHYSFTGSTTVNTDPLPFLLFTLMIPLCCLNIC